MSKSRRIALDLVKANETGAARISAVRLVMLATPAELKTIIHAYGV